MSAIMDDIDRAIIGLLMKDGRLSSSEIARRIDQVSRRTVRSRIRQLRTRGIMRVQAFLDPDALGYDVRADVSVETEHGKLTEVAEALASLDIVSYVAIMAGDPDLRIQVRVSDISALNDFILDTLQEMPGVRSSRGAVVAKVVKNIYDWEAPRERE